MKNYWLVKSEPDSYSWNDLMKDRLTSWTGVRNFTARNNLRAMAKGDEVFFYHSVTEKAVVGICEVKRTAYPDKTAKEGDWSTVDLVPKRKLTRPVTLAEIRSNPRLKDISLLRQSRLSVQPLTKDQFAEILNMAGK
jgi:predicted RNA-binding protein with PUA-like domain